MSLTRPLKRPRLARGSRRHKNKKPPCNTTRWKELKRTAQSPPLCLRREWRLRHSPTVVAGSSMDYRCTGTKGRASVVLRKEKATRRRSYRHLPSTSGEARGLCKGPQENEGVLEEDAYQPGNTRSRGHPDETIPQNNIHRQACVSTSTGSLEGDRIALVT